MKTTISFLTRNNQVDLYRLQRKMRDFFKISHVARKERATRIKSGGSDKAISQFQAVSTTDTASSPGYLGYGRDKRNSLQDVINNFYFLAAQGCVAEKFGFGDGRDINRDRGIIKNGLHERSNRCIVLHVINNRVRIERVHGYGS